MARCTRVLLSCLLLAVTFKAYSFAALDPLEDPTLEVIRGEDLEEVDPVYNKDKLVCKDVAADTNNVTVLEGNPPHLYGKVHVQCNDGLVFSSHPDLTSMNVTCDPAPHPCMCIAIWESIVANVVYDFNCTENVKCQWPVAADSNTVTVLKGNPPHLYAMLHVQCKDGLAFSNGLTNVNATCDPVPDPFRHVAVWGIVANIMYDFNCTDTLKCEEVNADSNIVTILEGDPPHMNAKVHVQCKDGLVFKTHHDLTSVNATCYPAPHPCMCIAVWETIVANIMHDFNCTEKSYCPEVSSSTNVVTEPSAGHYRLNSIINIKCASPGTSFNNGLTEVNATCFSTPHPCACIGYWHVREDDIMYNFTCTEKFHCWDPKTSSNIITELSGSDYHLDALINIRCAVPGTTFTSGKSDVNATCVPYPDPCMCRGGWNVHGDYNLREFTCTGDENTIDEAAPNSGYNVIGVKLKDDDTDLQPLEATGENEINWETQRRDIVEEPTFPLLAEPKLEQGPEQPFVNVQDEEETEQVEGVVEEHVNNDTEEQEQGGETEEDGEEVEEEEPSHVIEQEQPEETEETRAEDEEETTENVMNEEEEEEEALYNESENLADEEDVAAEIEQEEPGPLAQPKLEEEYENEEETEPTYHDEEHPIYPQGYDLFNEEEREDTQSNIEQNEDEKTDNELQIESDELATVVEEEDDDATNEVEYDNQGDAYEIEEPEQEEFSEETNPDTESSDTNIYYETELEEFEPEEDVEDPNYANNHVPEEEEEEEVEEVETSYTLEENEELTNEIEPSTEENEELEDESEPSNEENEELTNEIEPSTEETDFEVPRIFEYQPQEQVKRPSIILDALLDPIDKYQQAQEVSEDEEEEEESEVYDSLEDGEDVEAPGWFMDVQMEPVRESPVDVSPPEYTDACLLPPVTGPCKAALVRYFYDFSTGECQQFVYGGCNGNRNNFETLEDCLTKCVKDTYS